MWVIAFKLLILLLMHRALLSFTPLSISTKSYPWCLLLTQYPLPCFMLSLSTGTSEYGNVEFGSLTAAIYVGCWAPAATFITLISINIICTVSICTVSISVSITSAINTHYPLYVFCSPSFCFSELFSWRGWSQPLLLLFLFVNATNVPNVLTLLEKQQN